MIPLDPRTISQQTQQCIACGGTTELAISAGNLVKVCTKCGKTVCIN